MANPWVSQYRFGGWPDHAHIFLQVTDGNGGPPYTGQLELYMRKGNDLSSDVPIDMGNGQNLVADVQNGSWEMSNINLKTFDDAGFNTLVINCNGYRFARSFHTPQNQRQTSPPQTGHRSKNQPGSQPTQEEFRFYFTSFDKRKAVEIKDSDGKLTGYNVTVYGIVTKEQGQGKNKKKSQADGVEINIFRDSNEKVTDLPLTTDNDGNFSFTARNVPPGGYEGGNLIKLQARIKDFAIYSRVLDIEVVQPEKKKEEKLQATKLMSVVMSKTKVDDKTIRYSIRSLIVDQYKKGMGNIYISWTCGDQSGMTVTSDDPALKGWAEHEFAITAVGMKLSYQATAPAESLIGEPLELEGPKAVKTADNLRCEISTSKSTDGFFRVAIATFCKEEPVKAKFEICSADKFSLRDDTGRSLGTSCSFPYLETSANGTSAYYLRPEIGAKLQMLVTLKLANGFSCSQPVANITLKRAR